MRIYLNTSALNRPFDDHSSARVRLEAEAVAVLLAAIEHGAVEWISSAYVDFEVGQVADPERRYRVESLLTLASETVSMSSSVTKRARELERLGLRGLDALHVAAAESGRCDILVTTDDRLLRRASRAGDDIRVVVLTPAVAAEAISQEPRA